MQNINCQFLTPTSTNIGGYRYFFNGQEGDNEVFTENGLFAFEYRMHDARLGRFWSVDPLAAKYPWNSAYAFCENTPIWARELEGLEAYILFNKRTNKLALIPDISELKPALTMVYVSASEYAKFITPLKPSSNTKNNIIYLTLFVSRKICNFAATKKTSFMSTLEMQKELAEYFKTQPVLKAWLFGSYARGEETPESDVDVLVTLDYSQKVGLLKFASMYLDLKKLLNKEVDLVEDGTLRPYVAITADKDKKLIYERA